jgi:Fe-S-cluster containining protein
MDDIGMALKRQASGAAQNRCIECKAGCCRSVSVEWHTPEGKDDWDQIRWMVAHKNVYLYKDFDGEWLIEFQTDCEMLNKENMCKIYDKRMAICREHDSRECENSGIDSEYHQTIFRHVEDVDRYIAENNINFAGAGAGTALS